MQEKKKYCNCEYNRWQKTDDFVTESRSPWFHRHLIVTLAITSTAFTAIIARTCPRNNDRMTCVSVHKSSRQPSLSRFTAFLCYCAWSAHKSARFAIGHSCLLLHRAANSKQRNLATVYIYIYIKMKNKLLNFYAKNEKEGNYICINTVE